MSRKFKVVYQVTYECEVTLPDGCDDEGSFQDAISDIDIPEGGKKLATFYSGIMRLYEGNELIEAEYWTEKSKQEPNEWVQTQISKRLEIEIDLDCNIETGIEDYVKIVIDDEKVDEDGWLTPDGYEVETMQPLEQKCQCQCGKEVVHQSSPIPT